MTFSTPVGHLRGRPANLRIDHQLADLFNPKHSSSLGRSISVLGNGLLLRILCEPLVSLSNLKHRLYSSGIEHASRHGSGFLRQFIPPSASVPYCHSIHPSVGPSRTNHCEVRTTPCRSRL